MEHHASAAVFLTGGAFFQEFWMRPGGMADYAAAFLAQLNHANWLGAALYTVAAGLGYLFSRDLFGAMIRANPLPAQDSEDANLGSARWLLPFGPVFILLCLRNGYACPSLAPVLGWLLAVGLAAGYVRAPWAPAGLRISLCWIAAALLSYGAGPWPALLFAFIVALTERILRPQRPLLWIGCAVSGFALLIVGMTWFAATFPGAAQTWGAGGIRTLHIALYLFVPLSLLTILAAKRLCGNIHPQGARFQAAGLVTLLLGWIAVWMLFDAPRKTALQIDYFSTHDQHDQVLQAATRLDTLSAASEVRLHRALFHQGRLLEELFAWGHQSTWNLLPSLSYGLDACRPQSAALFELGQINVAEHMAHEALEYEGDRPELLRRLAMINVLKERPRAARVFLNVLSKMPSHRDQALTTRRHLESDPALSGDPEVNRVRALLATADQPHTALDPETLLVPLLQRNPQNRMAFEYLMAHYLLTRQLDKVAKELKRVNDLQYSALPRHLEEAVLLHQKLAVAQADLSERQIRPETRQRFDRFYEAVQRKAHETPEGRQAMLREFGGTYWLYHLLPPEASKPTSAGKTDSQ